MACSPETRSAPDLKCVASFQTPLGVPLLFLIAGAEITPSELDPGHAGAGK
jgi:hypothetical protein